MCIRDRNNHKNLRVITNNLNVAALLSENPNCEVIVAGGVVRRDRGVIGESTIDFIRQFKVDFGIIGISGIDEDGILLDFDYREVRVAQAIIENARQVFLVTDHTKSVSYTHLDVYKRQASTWLATMAPCFCAVNARVTAILASLNCPS